MTPPLSFELQSWRHKMAASATPLWKRAAYALLRPLFSGLASRHLSSEALRRLRPDLVLLTRGLPVESRRCWASAYQPITGLTVLVQGTGSGWDVMGWAARGPRRIIATDLFSFPDSWAEITEHCRRRYGVEVQFRQADLARHAFLDSGSVDLCVSDAVFEHCQDLQSVLLESWRILKPGGRLYAGYGPLWYCAGGDHYLRGGLRNAFNHVLLDAAEYHEHFARHLLPVEDFQSGGRYVELDLFSHLRTDQYLSLYSDIGFTREALVIELSPEALAFAHHYALRFAELQRRWPACSRDDFLIKANLVRLRKPTE